MLSFFRPKKSASPSVKRERVTGDLDSDPRFSQTHPDVKMSDTPETAYAHPTTADTNFISSEDQAPFEASAEPSKPRVPFDTPPPSSDPQVPFDTSPPSSPPRTGFNTPPPSSDPQTSSDQTLASSDPQTALGATFEFSDAREIFHELEMEDTPISHSPTGGSSPPTLHTEVEMNAASDIQNSQLLINAHLDRPVEAELPQTAGERTPGSNSSGLASADGASGLEPLPSVHNIHSQLTFSDMPLPTNDPDAPTMRDIHYPLIDDASEGSDQLLINSVSGMAHHGIPGEGSVLNHRKLNRCSSAPPEDRNIVHVPVTQHMKNVSEIGPAVTIPQNVPAHAQMLTYLTKWTPYLKTITDPVVRDQLITAIAQKMENTWLTAMRMDRIPIKWQDDIRLQKQVGNTDLDVDVIGWEQRDITIDDITQHELYPRGRMLYKEKGKKKRPTSPGREIVIDTKGHKGSKLYGIIAGELSEFGVNMHSVHSRAATRRLDDTDRLLSWTLAELNQDDILECNWRGVRPVTAYNTLGRDLKLYCLWEMLRSRAERRFLESLLPKFPHANQVKNTRNRIQAEQELHDQLQATALELHLQEEGEDFADEADSESEEEVEVVASGSGTSPNAFGDADDDHQQPMEENAGGMQALQASAMDPVLDEQEDKIIPSQEAIMQQYWEDDTSINPMPEHVHNTQQQQTPAPIIKTEHGYKRALSETDPISGPPPKKPRFEVLDDEVDLPDTRAASASAESMSSSFPPETSLKQRAYVRFVLRPAANMHLRKARRPIVSEEASWPEIRDALIAAGIHASTRNDLVRDYKQCIDNWDMPIKEEDGEVELDDIDGYPTRKEIFNAISPEGMKNDDLKAVFGNRVSSMDLKWQTLVFSVAYHDPAAGRWYRKDELAEKLRHRLVVKLKLPNRKRFNPEDYSSRIVNNTHGFRWRYVPTSTVAQREATDEVILQYVQHTKEGEKAAKEKAKAAGIKKPFLYNYRGRYEVLPNPATYHPDVGLPTAIVHGIWDMRGQKKQDNRVPGMEWFYEGKDGEVCDKWIVRYDTSPDGTQKRVVEKEIEGTDAEDQIKGKHLRPEPSKHTRDMPGKGGKKLKLNISSMVAGTGTGLDGAIGPSRGVSGKRGGALGYARGRSVAKGGAGKSKKGKSAMQAPQPIALARGRRVTTKVSYTESGIEDSDGEYMP